MTTSSDDRRTGDGRAGAARPGPARRPPQGGPPPRPGPRRLRRRRQGARDGLPPFRPLAVRPCAHHVDRRLRRGEAPGGLRDAHRRGGRRPDRPVLPDRVRARRERRRTTRSRSARCALSASRSSRWSPRRARQRVTPPSSSRSNTSQSMRSPMHAMRRPTACRHRRGAGGNLMWTGLYEWGDLDCRVRRRRTRS